MVRSKHCTLERWLCYTISVTLTVAVIAVVVVVTRSVDNTASDALTRNGHVWHYKCEAKQCVKLPITEATEAPIGLVQCRHTCGHGGRSQGIDVWPKLTGAIDAGNAISYAPLWLPELRFEEPAVVVQPDVPFWRLNHDRLVGQIRAKRTAQTSAAEPTTASEDSVKVNVAIVVASADVKLHMAGNETYRLTVSAVRGDAVAVTIEAETIFGARHGIETLSQLVIYDDMNDRYLLRTEVRIEDGPVYTHRGISLDTSRNYYSVATLKRTIDAMAMVKLNVFHWHITDSHSFPVVIKSHPYLHQYGAYTPDKVYTAADVQDIVRYAYVRGVHVLPEFDAPAHVGEGWQFTNLTTCFNIQPWANYCYEAPCGQLDPTQDKVYDILGDVYGELLEMFGHPEWFHMGGDEVKSECWATSDTLNAWMVARDWPLTKDGYMRLWDHFQRNALARLDKAAWQRNAKIVMWTSTLTEDPYVDQYLDPERYVVQVWTKANDAGIAKLLAKGFDLVMSNHDVLYLDCGYESWTGLGNNWCGAYSGWHKIYNQDLKVVGGDRHKQIIGSEVALWSEQADDQSLDGRIWPRAAALAERLWSDPSTSFRLAEPRILLQRERLVENGVRAEALQPEWCVQNEGNCMHD